MLSYAGLTNGAGGGHEGIPRIGFPSAEMGSQDGGLARHVDVHGEWYEYVGSGVT